MMDEQNLAEPHETESDVSLPRNRLRKLGVFAICVGLLALLAGVAGLAVYHGLQDRAAAVQRNAQSHYEAGLQYFQDGNADMAIAEFELALRLSPDHAAAREKMSEAQRTRLAVKTPTSEVYTAVLDGFFTQAVSLFDEGNWADAAAAFAHITTLDAEYHPQDIQQYRFDCYRLLGESYESENRLEETIRAYDQALRVRPSDNDVARRREMLALYVAGAGAAGADWNRAITAFKQLYAIDPDYRDVEQRLYDAYIGYGDAYMGWGLWCQAQDTYTIARDMENNATIRGKLNDATQRCEALAMATAVPEPTRAAEPLLSRLPSGTLLASQYDDKRKTYDVILLSAATQERNTLASNATQPSASPDGERVAFRSTDRTAPGIFVMELQSGKRVAITTSVRDSRPFWSPDGTQVAFIRDADAPTASILAAPADGTGSPAPLADGWSAAWSRTNHLAFTGCDENQTECGIFVDDLSQGGRIRITADKNDIGLAWSPDGSHVAYISSHDGNWEIYTVRLEGGFVRRCTVNSADDGVPVWSPDGQHIAFASNRDGVWALYVMLTDGSEQRKIMDLSMSNPEWTRDQMAWLP